MDKCTEILKKYEHKNIDYNERIYKKVLNDFEKAIDSKINFVNCKNYGEKVRSLKDEYIYDSEYIDLFFNILKKYNYNMKNEIIDAILTLSNMENPNQNKELFYRLINSPVIDDISFDGKNIFSIFSNEYGPISFELANYALRKDQNLTEYINNNPLRNHCHNHTYYISKLPNFQNHFSITSLCKSYFGESTFYHSYTYDQTTNSIIDLCFNAIINKEQYYTIFEPKEISIIENKNVEDELTITNTNSSQVNTRCELLKIALYKQYLNNIGYQGSLEKAPLIKKIK